jgi:hypothetical protein
VIDWTFLSFEWFYEVNFKNASCEVFKIFWTLIHTITRAAVNCMKILLTFRDHWILSPIVVQFCKTVRITDLNDPWNTSWLTENTLVWKSEEASIVQRSQHWETNYTTFPFEKFLIDYTKCFVNLWLTEHFFLSNDFAKWILKMLLVRFSKSSLIQTITRAAVNGMEILLTFRDHADSLWILWPSGFQLYDCQNYRFKWLQKHSVIEREMKQQLFKIPVTHWEPIIQHFTLKVSDWFHKMLC